MTQGNGFESSNADDQPALPGPPDATLETEEEEPFRNRRETLGKAKTLADEMNDLAERLSATSLYVNKLLEVVLMSPCEYAELSKQGLVEPPLIPSLKEKKLPASFASLLEAAKSSDMEAVAEELLSRLQKKD